MRKHFLPLSYQQQQSSSSYISDDSSSSSDGAPDENTSLIYSITDQEDDDLESETTGGSSSSQQNEDSNATAISAMKKRQFRRRIHGRRSSPNNNKNNMMWGLILLSIGSVFILAPHIPWTQQERDIAKAYNLPLLGHAKQIRQGQRLATKAQKKHFIHKIDHKHHSKHNRTTYMEIPENCEATVLLLRHCEKSNIREHCSYLGFERSVYLASQFGTNQTDRWPLPTWIFAQRPNQRHNRKKMNFREVETVGPLAAKAAVTVDDSHASPNPLAKELLTFLHSGQMCGQVAVVAWKHSDIGHLAHHLGCGPLQGCPVDYSGRTFDAVWQIKFVYRQWEHSSRKNLQLPRQPSWRAFGSVMPEGFDPLAFSKRAGDYAGLPAGGAWRQSQVAIPERKRVTDKRAWQATRVGFALPQEQRNNEHQHG